jgi:5-methylcytosine-specific restriction endonuclease McrA
MFEYNPAPKPTSKRRVKKTAERSKFSKMVRDAIKEKHNGLCAICSNRAFHVHHVMPRARGGRNVITNATLLCAACHRKVHEDEQLLKYFIEKHKKLFGKNFYKDREDLIWEYKTDQFKEMGKEVEMWVKYNGEAY